MLGTFTLLFMLGLSTGSYPHGHECGDRNGDDGDDAGLHHAEIVLYR